MISGAECEEGFRRKGWGPEHRIGDGGRPEIVEAEAVRLIFRLYVHEGMGVPLIAQHLEGEAVSMRNPDKRWHHTHIHRILDNETYKGTWWYGRTRQIATEDGLRVYEQPKDTWIGVPFPPLVDEQTWDRVRVLKKRRLLRAKRNTKLFYMLQHIVTCAECGRLMGARTNRTGTTKHNGKTYAYELDPPNTSSNGVRRPTCMMLLVPSETPRLMNSRSSVD